MVEKNDSLNLKHSATDSLMDAWTLAMGRTTASLGSLSPDPTGDAQAWRRQLFQAMSQTTDVYLRSPLFLRLLKTHLAQLVAAKQLLNRRGSPVPATRSSPSGLVADTLGTESTAVDARGTDKLARDVKLMHQRLKQLRQRLDAMEELTTDVATADDSPQSKSSARAVPESYPKNSEHLDKTAGEETFHGATESQVVYQSGKFKLRWYPGYRITLAEPVLVCFALVNRPYILDLKAERSVIRRLLERGFEVFLIDWGVPAATDSGLTLDDYVCEFLNKSVELTCQLAKGNEGKPCSRVNLLGYCMGGTLATMYTALHPRKIRNLVLMATPIDFSGEEGLLYLWSRPDVFDVDQLIDAYGNCPGELLQFCFQLMKPVQNFAEKQLALCENLTDASYVDSFVAVEQWANDSIPVAGETFRQYVKTLFQQNRLVTGDMSLAGRPVRLESITCPLLLLVAEKDHLVPPNSTLALLQHAASKDTRTLSIDAGHVGLAVSSKAHRRLWPEAAEWLAERSTVT